MDPIRVLFVCIHNSARSQMAEAFANQLGRGRVVAESAGLTPGRMNRRVVTVMQEVGIDLSLKGTRSIEQMLNKQFDYVITVCDETSAGRCPAFPGTAKRLHWGFPDPSSFSGAEADVLQGTREVRDQIRAQVNAWLSGLLA